MGTTKNHGKYIETPEIMWQHFLSYKKNIKDNPILKHDFVGKDAQEVQRKLERPLTMEGFENWLNDKDIITDITDYFENKDNRYKNYVRVCSRIKKTIRQDQIEGGMANNYNPSITQRLNGLTENIVTTNRTIEVHIKDEE